MENLCDVLVRPVITEKSNQLMEESKYTFIVSLKATKVEIRQAVEKMFKVQVEAVNTVRVMGKTKRMGNHEGKRPDFKKAIVKLAPGQSIAFFEGV